MEKKITKREHYNTIKELLADYPEIVSFCDHEIELLDKKKSNGKGKVDETKTANMELVYTELAKVGRATATELISKADLSPLANELQIVTTQKVSAYLNKLVDMGRVEKVVEKKKTYFSVITKN
jgi:hypothetical protein